ncbi:MAG: thiamine phosphate synthase [Geminicoccaceae bacterium]
MRPRPDLRVYLVTDPRLPASELLDRVAAAARSGATIVQLRHKGGDLATLVAAGRALRAVLDPLGVPLIVNDSVEAAVAVGAAGVHLGQSDGPPADARARLGDRAVIGLSLERLADIATADPAVVDYVAASPVFATPTKADIAPPLGLAGVRAIRSALPLPLVGIGGIDAGNAADVIAAGADGVAVVSAILAAADSGLATAGLRRAVDAALSAAGRAP